MKESVEKALNNQINAELQSAYLYLSMSAYFESINLKGFANWMRIQAQEEAGHAMRFFKFIFDRNGRVTLYSIDEPKGTWKSPLDAFENVYSHEQKVTGLINGLVDLAKKENDHATENFLQWFVGEQVEEEASALEIVEKLRFIKDSANGLLRLDSELAKRGKS
ncbi:MAG: ferritin [Spirochaetota bacterium]